MIPSPQYKRRLRLSVCLLLIAVSGCLGASPPVRFYALAPMTGEIPSDRFSGFPKDLVVGVGPIEIPELYNRPQIVTKTGENQVALSESHRWAGSLQEDILTVLTENLSRMLESERIVPFPWDGIPEPDIQIAIQVHRFEGSLEKRAIWVATWSMKSAKEQRALVVKKTSLEEPLIEKSYPALVAAKSRLLAAFSRELAFQVVKSFLE